MLCNMFLYVVQHIFGPSRKRCKVRESSRILHFLQIVDGHILHFSQSCRQTFAFFADSCRRMHK